MIIQAVDDLEEDELVVISNLPGFSSGHSSVTMPQPEFKIVDGLSDVDLLADGRDLHADLQSINVFLDVDFGAAVPSEDTGNAVNLEYVLLAVFGSVAALFLLCQIYIHCKAFVTKKQRTWRIGSHRWLSTNGRAKGPCSFRSGSDRDTTVWAHRYEPYAAAPCGHGLAYGNASCHPRKGSSDSCDESCSDFAVDAKSHPLRSAGSRSALSCGSASTLYLLGSNLENRRVGPHFARTDAVVQVHTPCPPPDGATCRLDATSSESSVSSASPSMADKDGVMPPRLPIYHALLASSVPCENPGYDTDADSIPKMADSELTSSSGSETKSVGALRSLLRQRPGGSSEDGSDGGNCSSTAGHKDMDKRSQKSDDSLTTVSSMSASGSRHTSEKTLSRTSGSLG